MPVIKATDANYEQLIAQPGLTLVMYDDTRDNYGNCAKLRAAFRARAANGRMGVVLFDARVMTVDPGPLYYLPTFRMYRDGACVKGWDTNLPRSDRALAAWADSFLPEEDRAVLGSIAYRLPNGIELSLTDIHEPIPARSVADFLADALNHFKRHRDVLKTVDYAKGPYSGATRARPRGRALCRMSVRNPGDREGRRLTAAQWVEAVIAAYTAANTVEQIVDQLDDYRAAVAREPGSWLADAVGLLDRPHGELLALRCVLEERPRI